jgi:hypothetical protein
MQLLPYSRIAVRSLCTVALAALMVSVAFADQPGKRADVQPLGKAVPTNDLDKQRGGTVSVENHMQVNGALTDTSAFDVLTGTNSINGGAFSGASGIPMVIQNTGNNVLIQNGTIINLQLK